MLKSTPFANAVTTVVIGLYSVFVGLSYIAPDLMFDVSQPWIHSLNIQAGRASKVIPYEKALFGLLTIAVFTWIATFFAIELYNRMIKK